jgi:hypothetical protein
MSKSHINENNKQARKLAKNLFNNHKWIRNTLNSLPTTEILVLLDIEFSTYKLAYQAATKNYFWSRHPSLQIAVKKRHALSRYYNYFLTINKLDNTYQLLVTLSKVKLEPSFSDFSSTSTSTQLL